MPKSQKRAPVKKAGAAKKASAAKKTRAAADEAAYLETLVKTGQAVPAGRGKMPPGATHVLEPCDDGTVKAVRRRTSIA